MHFLWIGNNDILPFIHINLGGNNTQFASDLASLIADQVQTLVDAGATTVFVPSVYPRHVAPVVNAYFTNSTSDVTNYGEAIQQVNTNLATNLQKFGDKAIYYDAYGFMMNLWQNPLSQGFTHTAQFADFCDGCNVDAEPGISNWDLCMQQGQANTFYWMQFLDPTTKVHQLLAADMENAIRSHFGN